MKPLGALLPGRPAVLTVALALWVAILAAALTTTGARTAAMAPAQAQTWTVAAEFSPFSAAPLAGAGWQISGPSGPAFGPLQYDPDLKAVERYAHGLLVASKAFREDISPHREKKSFQSLVAGFDYGVGFNVAYAGAQTLGQRIDRADSDLRAARDAYAFLTAAGAERDFRADPGNDALCLKPPALEDPFADEPVIDWCAFAARTRQSLREAAYIRMIFGQQFTADALGFTFSGDMFGGDGIVANEIRRLRDAETQFRRAREAVAEGLWSYAGYGCYVADFYTDVEWTLLSRAVEGLERARREVGVRQSYMAISPSGAESARRDAIRTIGHATTEQFLDLALAAGQDIAVPCDAVAAPADHGVAEDVTVKMVAALQRSRLAADDLRDGRNIFGYDVRFTPARPLHTALGGSDKGLYEQAKELADGALRDEDALKKTERFFDSQASALAVRLSDVSTRYDNALADLTGCPKPDPAGVNSDEDFFQCAHAAADKLRLCDPLASDAFESCVQATAVTGKMLEEWRNVKEAALRVRATEIKRDNFRLRATFELERSATVRHATLTNGRDQAILEFAATILGSLSVSMGLPNVVNVTNNPAQPAIAAARTGQVLRQMVADMAIEGANSTSVVQNLMLDAVEVSAELDVVGHQLASQLVAFNNLAAGTQDLLVEARRAHDYVKISPANDPSYRLIRDGERIKLADKLALASRTAYLAAKRAEYEQAGNLSRARDFAVSDIYRARTAGDVDRYLDRLSFVMTNSFQKDTELHQETFTLSVARHVLGLTNEALGLTGSAAAAERKRLFQLWVADHATGIGDDAKLVFDVGTSPDDQGVFSDAIRLVYQDWWLHKVSSIGLPLPSSSGFGVNLIVDGADAAALGYRWINVSQGGILHLKGRDGCVYEYRLLHPAALLGLPWVEGEAADTAHATVRGQINGVVQPRTSAFGGRPVSATDWRLEVLAGSPEGRLPVLDLADLEDIELLFDSTYARRTSTGRPPPEACRRVDY